MTHDTQLRKRKDKRNKKESGDENGSATYSDEEKYGKGGTTCLSALVFIVLAGTVALFFGLIYIQVYGVKFVDVQVNPAPASPVSAKDDEQKSAVREEIQSSSKEELESVGGSLEQSEVIMSTVAADASDMPVQHVDADAGVVVVEQQVEEVQEVHYVQEQLVPVLETVVEVHAEEVEVADTNAAVDPQPDQHQHHHHHQLQEDQQMPPPEELPFQLEGSESDPLQHQQSQRLMQAQPSPEQLQRVRVKQIVKVHTDADGRVYEEVVSEEVLEGATEEDLNAGTLVEDVDPDMLEKLGDHEAAERAREQLLARQTAAAASEEQTGAAAGGDGEEVVAQQQQSRPLDPAPTNTEQPKDKSSSAEKKEDKKPVVAEKKDRVPVAAEKEKHKVPAPAEKKVPVTAEKKDKVPSEKVAEKKDKVSAEKKDKVASDKKDKVLAEKKDKVSAEKKDKVSAEKKDKVSAEKKDKVAVAAETSKSTQVNEKPSSDSVKTVKSATKPAQSEKIVKNAEPKPVKSEEKPKADGTPKKISEKMSNEKPQSKPAVRKDENKPKETVKPNSKTSSKPAESKKKQDTEKAGKPKSTGPVVADVGGDPVVGSTNTGGRKSGKQKKDTVDEGIVADMDDIPSTEDLKMKAKLDSSDNLLHTDPAAALSAFNQLLTGGSGFPRALWGRGRALSLLADQLSSNSHRQRAVEAFTELLATDRQLQLPSALYRLAAAECVKQMKLLGQYDKAIRVQQRAVQRLPDDVDLRNQLMVLFMELNRYSPAEEVLIETLRGWPSDGVALVHLGFIRRRQDRLEEAAGLLQRGLDSGQEGVHQARFYQFLADTYSRLDQQRRSDEVMEEAVRRGLFPSFYQRSTYNVPGLTSRPFWPPLQSGAAELIRDLEENWMSIRAEMLQVLDSQRSEDGFKAESEQLLRRGSWSQYTMFSRGRPDQYRCVQTPVTCKLVARHRQASRCRRGQVKFSVLSGGTQVWPHSGPTNCRLRAHMGLLVPSGAYIRVANVTRTWQEGKVLVLDDSLLHEVWHQGSERRVILIVDFWHPELSEHLRDTLPAI